MTPTATKFSTRNGLPGTTAEDSMQLPSTRNDLVNQQFIYDIFYNQCHGPSHCCGDVTSAQNDQLCLNLRLQPAIQCCHSGNGHSYGFTAIWLVPPSSMAQRSRFGTVPIVRPVCPVWPRHTKSCGFRHINRANCSTYDKGLFMPRWLAGNNGNNIGDQQI